MATWKGPQMHLSATGDLGGRPVCNTRRAVMSTNLKGESGCRAFQEYPVNQRCEKCNARYMTLLQRGQAN